MSLWNNKINRTIMISSIFIVLILALILFATLFDIVNNPVSGLLWFFKPGVIYSVVILLFWGLYFNILLLVGSIREKMNALPGWIEVIICAIIVLLTSIFVPNNLSENFPIDWIVFGGTALGVILITLYFLMSNTPREAAQTKTK